MDIDGRQLKALQDREPGAWLAVYHERGAICSVTSTICFVAISAVYEETCQSIWLIAIDKFRQFDPQRGTLRNWLFAIARQQVVLHYRATQAARSKKATRSYCVSSWEAVRPEDASLVTPPQVMEQLERRDVVRAAMLCLSDDRRQVLLLGKYVDGLTVSELAASTSRTEKAVESLLSRAIARWCWAYWPTILRRHKKE